MIPVSELERFKEEAFKNACRLFIDSCILFESGRYPSSFALCVSAYEEVGKLCLADRTMDVMYMNPESAKRLYDSGFSKDRLSSHVSKHTQALFDASSILPFEENKRIWSYFESGGLEQDRQKALYVDYINETTETPRRITKEKSFQMLERCFSALEGVEDLGFNGYHCFSSEKSMFMAKQSMEPVVEYYDRCKTHNKTSKKDAQKTRASS